MAYSREERARARSTIKRLQNLTNEARFASQRGIILPNEMETAIYGLTKTEDRSKRVEVLAQLTERLRESHLAKLRPLAANEFNAFCEYVNPEEPPESRFHIYLTDLLQKVDTEAGYERFVLNVPPGHAKPLAVHTRILMGDGTWKALGDIRVGDKVITHTGKSRRVEAVHEQGELDCLKIMTENGREIISAPDHSFLAYPEGKRSKPTWVPAGELRVRQRLVMPPDVPFENKSGKDKDWFRLAAYWSGCGGFQNNRLPTYKNYDLYAADLEVHQEMQACLSRLGIGYDTFEYEGLFHVRLDNPDVDRLDAIFHFKNVAAAERCLPDFVWKGGREEILAFIQTLFRAKGTAPLRFTLPRIHLTLTSRQLAEEVQRLLIRFGIGCEIASRGKRHARLMLRSGQVRAFLDTKIVYGGENGAHFEKTLEAEGQTVSPADRVYRIGNYGKAQCRCLTVEVDHSFVAEGLVVHNSTYASRLYVAWRMGRRPRDKIIGGGHSQQFVENEFSKKIRNVVGSNAYREIFPNVVIDANTRAAAQWALAGTGGQYVAKGAGQGIHGFRANFICVDDPYPSFDAAESATVRESVKTWFFVDLGSRLLPSGVVFLIMTRFHEDDLTGACIEANKKLKPEKQYRIVSIPAVCYDPENDVMNRDLGEVLWEYYSHDEFLEKRATWKFSRYMLAYQQITNASSDDSIASKFKYYDEPPWATDALKAKARALGHIDETTGRPIVDKRDFFRRIITSVDTAAKTTERADYTVAQVWGQSYDKKLYLIDQVRGKWEMPEMIRQIANISAKHKVDAILVEDKGQGTSYIQTQGTTETQARLAPAPVVAIKVPSNQGKEFRFDEVTPMIEAGEVYLPSTPDWIDLFLQEIGQFPDAPHDDQVDAMSQALKWFKSKRTRYGSKKVGSLG